MVAVISVVHRPQHTAVAEIIGHWSVTDVVQHRDPRPAGECGATTAPHQLRFLLKCSVVEDRATATEPLLVSTHS